MGNELGEAMDKRRKRGMADPRKFSIGALSRATRIPVETLRTWERRYGSPMPVRKPSGHRLYTAESVERLRRVARLLALGHRPNEIVPLSERALDALLALAEPRGDRLAAVSLPDVHAAEGFERSIAAMLQATMELDRGPLMRELSANWVRFGPLHFLQDLGGPFMIEIGRAWHEGRLQVRHEHFASACLSDFLREVREPYDREARGPRVAAATLPGDAHEGGLLMACTIMALHGYRVVYLGANAPIDQIAEAATTVNAEAVTVSISAAKRHARSVRAVVELRALLPKRVPLWVGGAGAPEASTGAECFPNLAAFEARLAGGS